jgi:hypothetical protein
MANNFRVKTLLADSISTSGEIIANNLIYTTGNQTIDGIKTFNSTIIGSVNGNAGSVTNGVYTTGNQIISGEKTFDSLSASSVIGILIFI